MNPEPVEDIVRQLDARGYAVRDEFLPAPAVAHLGDACRVDADTGRMRPAAVGRGPGRLQRAEVRGDAIRWLDDAENLPAWQDYRANLDVLRMSVNRTFFLGLHEFEAHLAVYPPGARYLRHLDQFGDHLARRLTAILYLNDGWTVADGGLLRLYLEDGTPHDILPVGGRLVVFFSERFEHEVFPSCRARYALTGWFRTRPDTPFL